MTVRADAPVSVAGRLPERLGVPALAARRPADDESASMLSAAERSMLTALVRDTWRGAGVIVDAGSFLGSSLIAEADGLETHAGAADTGHFPAGRALHGFERGHLAAPPQGAGPLTHRYGDIEIVLGESFVPQLEANLGRHRDRIALHLGDLTEERWDGSPIEIAFIDVCKTAELNAHVSREFYPALVAGATLIHQDFFFDQLPWLRVTMGQLAEHVTWEGQVATSSLYRVHTPIPASLVAHDPFLDGSLEECLRLHDAVAFDGIDRATELMLALSRVELVLVKGTAGEALDLLRDAAIEYADVVGPISRVDSHRPAYGAPETMTPRYRLDRVISRVLATTRDPRPTEATESAESAESAEPTESAGSAMRDRVADALARRDFDGARRVLHGADGDPATLLLARTEFEAGDAGRAAELLERLLGRRPHHPRAHALLGRIELERGDPVAAREHAEAALGRRPGLSPGRRLLFDVEVVEALAAAGRP